MPNRPGKGPLSNVPRRRGSIGNLLSSTPTLEVDPEALIQYDEEAAPGTQRAPLFKGERAKLFGLIPYGENPADVANTAFAYEQASGNAANQRAINLQKGLIPVLDQLDKLKADREAFKTAERDRLLNQLGIKTRRAESRIKLREEEAGVPIAGRRAQAVALGTLLGGLGGAIDDQDVNMLANDFAKSTLLNRGSEQDRLGITQREIFPSLLSTAKSDAARGASEAQTRLNTAQSLLGQRALDLGTRGGYLQQYANALKTGTTELGPGQVSYQNLAPLFSDIRVSYENRGPTPVETAVYNRQKVGDVETSTYGGTLRNLLYDAGQAPPALIAEAQANLDSGQSGRAPASRVGPYSDGYQYVNPASAPTPAPAPAAAPAPAPAPIINRSRVTQPVLPAREQRAAKLMQELGLQHPSIGVGRTAKPDVSPEAYREVLAQELSRREAEAKNAPSRAKGRAKEKINEHYLKNLRQLLSEYYE